MQSSYQGNKEILPFCIFLSDGRNETDYIIVIAVTTDTIFETIILLQ
jgi:hypothetical protein